MRVKIRLQNSEQDCLLACFSMVLSSLGIDRLPHELYEDDAVPPDGLKASYLHTLDQRLGTRTRAFRDSGDVPVHAVFRSFSGPAIAHWNGNHFVVVTSVSRQYARVIDPALGRVRMSIEDFQRHFAGTWILVAPVPEATVTVPPPVRPQSVIHAFISKHLGLLIVGLAVGQGASIAIAAGVRQVLSSSHIWAVTTGLILLLIGLYTASAIALTISQRGLSDRFEQRYSGPLFTSFLNRPFLYFKSQTTGSLLEILSLRGALRDTVLASAVPSAVSFLTVLVLVAYLAWVSLPLTLTACAIALLFTTLAVFAIQRERDASQNYVQQQVSFSSAIQHDIFSIEEAKVTRTEDDVAERWREENSHLTRAFKATLGAQNLSMSIQRAYYGVSLVITAAAGIYLYQQSIIGMPDLVLFQAGVGMLASSTTELNNFFVAWAKAMVFEQRQAPLRQPNRAVKPDRVDESSGSLLQGRDLSFSYPGGDLVFEPTVLDIRRGEKIAVIGESGSGKSTFMHVLLGLVNHDGDVVFGHRDVRRELGVVLPGMALHAGTLRNNIVGDSGAEDAHLWQALDAVGLAETVASLPLGLDSAVFENGKNFSSGQAQRLLIAKSLLRGRSAVFWDEALSGLDSFTRQKVYRHVLDAESYGDVTMVMVSHQLDILPHVDRVVFLVGNGESPLIGEHDRLLSTSDAYARYVEGAAGRIVN